jgi:hypothetical protein
MHTTPAGATRQALELELEPTEVDYARVIAAATRALDEDFDSMLRLEHYAGLHVGAPYGTCTLCIVHRTAR